MMYSRSRSDDWDMAQCLVCSNLVTGPSQLKQPVSELIYAGLTHQFVFCLIGRVGWS